MSELPCIGAGITVVDPGPADTAYTRGRNGFMKRKRSRGYTPRDSAHARLLRAAVTEISAHDEKRGSLITWQSGKRLGQVWTCNEGTEWVHGHGPQARGALLAQRALERQR